MDDKHYKALMAELEEHKLQLAYLLEEKHELAVQVDNLTCERDALQVEREELLLKLGRAEGMAEAYAHCIDVMNGIQHEKKVGFRHADG